MKFKVMILALMLCGVANAQFKNQADIANYTSNWHVLYIDSLAATTSEDTLVLPSGFIYNIEIIARGANMLYKTTKASAYQKWCPLLQNESDAYMGTASVDSIFFKTSSGSGAVIVKWSKF